MYLSYVIVINIYDNFWLSTGVQTKQEYIRNDWK